MTPAFSNFPEDERALSVGSYLISFAELGLLVLAFGWGARRLRRAALGGWSGAPALLVDLVVAIAALIAVSELIGTFGAFGELEMLVAGGLFALACAAAARPLERRVGTGSAPPSPGQSAAASAVAAVVVAAVVAGWMVPTLATLAGGMDRADTLWYHMPEAAKFVQTGSLGEVHFFDPIFFASFYPSNSEILHAVPILAFDRDIVSPFLNLGLLAIGLLATWCIGRPYGMAPQALIGGCAALGAQMLVEFQAGEALNDITGVVFILAAVAVLVNGYAAGNGKERGTNGRSIGFAALAVAGLGAGLAAGMKLSFLAPVVALTIGVVVLAHRGSSTRVALVWTIPVLVGCVYWYARNAIATGNPIPYISSIGPIDLPAPERGFELRPGLAISHYLTDVDIWYDWFIPGFNESFGDLWPLTFALMAGGAVVAMLRGSEPVLRMLGAVVAFTAVAYVFTPLTAAGEEGQPIAFVWNVRYIAPAVAIGVALVPCLVAARSTSRRRLVTTVVLTIAAAITVASLVQWKQGHVKGAIAAAVCVLIAAALYAWLRSRGRLGPAAPRRSVLVVAAALLLVTAVAGFVAQRHYMERRYEDTSPRLQLASTLRWAQGVKDARFAVAGIRGVFNQYPLYGPDLSNHVQWLGIRGENDAYLRIPTCERWRERLNEGNYTHVVTTYDPFHPGRLTDTKEALWTRSDPAAVQILRDGPVSLFEIRGRMDPDGCAGLPDLSPAEVNGDSVNIEPLANQPPGTGPRNTDLSEALEGTG